MVLCLVGTYVVGCKVLWTFTRLVGKDVPPLKSVKLIYQSCLQLWEARTLTWLHDGTKLNLTCIALYLVITNKILINKIKSYPQPQPVFLVSLALHFSSTLAEVINRYRRKKATMKSSKRSRSSSPSKLWLWRISLPYGVLYLVILYQNSIM